VRDINEIMNIYTTAWDKGLKTTYYLHMKPRHSAEQSTTTVNKAEALGKRGFAILKDKPKQEEPAQEIEAILSEVNGDGNMIGETDIIIQAPKIELAQKLNIHISEDPQEQFLCEGCQ
jgi:ribonucleotide reductase alpha subunit